MIIDSLSEDEISGSIILPPATSKAGRLSNSISVTSNLKDHNLSIQKFPSISFFPKKKHCNQIKTQQQSPTPLNSIKFTPIDLLSSWRTTTDKNWKISREPGVSQSARDENWKN